MVNADKSWKTDEGDSDICCAHTRLAKNYSKQPPEKKCKEAADDSHDQQKISHPTYSFRSLRSP